MSRCRRAGPIALSASLLLAAVARDAHADLAPPPRYEETCTTARQARAGEKCESCVADFRDAAKCARTQATRGLELRCRTRGQSAWTEIWCGSAAAASPSGAASSAPSGATSAPVTSTPAPAASPSGAAGAPGTAGGCSLATNVPGKRPATLALLPLLLAALAARGRTRLRRARAFR